MSRLDSGSPARSMSVVAPRRPGELLHSVLHNPRLRRLARGIIRNSSHECDEVSAERQRENSRFLGNSAQVAERTNRRPLTGGLPQVLMFRILNARGEVAEWPKAAVC